MLEHEKRDLNQVKIKIVARRSIEAFHTIENAELDKKKRWQTRLSSFHENRSCKLE